MTREWLVIESSRKNAVFAPDEARSQKGYIPRDVAERLLGRDLGGTVWFTAEESALLRQHEEWLETIPTGAKAMTDIERLIAELEQMLKWMTGCSNAGKDTITEAIAQLRADHPEGGVTVVGIKLPYDCPKCGTPVHNYTGECWTCGYKPVAAPIAPGPEAVVQAEIDWSQPLETTEARPRPAHVVGDSKGTIDYIGVRIDEGVDAQSGFHHPAGEYCASKKTGFIRGTLAVRNVQNKAVGPLDYAAQAKAVERAKGSLKGQLAATNGIAFMQSFLREEIAALSAAAATLCRLSEAPIEELGGSA